MLNLIEFPSFYPCIIRKPANASVDYSLKIIFVSLS